MRSKKGQLYQSSQESSLELNWKLQINLIAKVLKRDRCSSFICIKLSINHLFGKRNWSMKCEKSSRTAI